MGFIKRKIILVAILCLFPNIAVASGEQVVSAFLGDIVVVAKTLNGDEKTLSNYFELAEVNKKRFNFLNDYWWSLTSKSCKGEYEKEISSRVDAMTSEQRKEYMFGGNRQLTNEVHRAVRSCRYQFINDKWPEIKKAIDLGLAENITK